MTVDAAKRADIALPPLAAVETALRETTEILARELGSPTRSAPAWGDAHWRIALAAATIHGVAPLLATRLQWRGPSQWQLFLDAQRSHTAHRHERLTSHLMRIAAYARRAGIPFTALKGAVLHELGIYRAGERPMADIDLLVKRKDVDAMGRVLKSLRYQEVYVTSRERVFMPSDRHPDLGYGEHANNAVKIEIHWRIAQRLPLDETEITDALFPRPARPGANPYPSLSILMMHLLLHAAGHMRMRGLRLIQIHDIALLAARLGPGDWDSLFESAGARKLWWAYPPLALTARYYQRAIPAVVLERAQAECPWALVRSCGEQTLSDVSMSSLWIQAFPGIEWSTSLVEAFRYIRARLLPSRNVRAEHRLSAATQGWASHSRWMGSSHLGRMARWAFSRPPRVETLSSVRAAWQLALTPP